MLSSSKTKTQEARASKVEQELAQGKTGGISIITLVEALIEEAHRRRASDIHIDPLERDVKVRFRIDGVLNDVYVFPKDIQQEVVSRIKVLAGLRTDEHQMAQDGRFRVVFEPSGVMIDIRVSIAPTYYGENAVLRLLAKRTEDYLLADLGIPETDRKKLESALRSPFGMILATGPTGSGKTTTLYTMLKMLHSREVSIVTIEDPIEYSIEGINQMQVNPRTGLTFASGLRAILRQDPDIIMVGEIRDPETANIAVNTALTGHLLLSTLHTNDAATTLPRLLDLGVEPYLIAATVNVVIGQRLVRKVCNGCAKERPLSKDEQSRLGELRAHGLPESLKSVRLGEGCDECAGTGFCGRIGIYEVIAVDEPIRQAMLERKSARDIRKLAIERGMRTMVADGFSKVAAGITTIGEVLRVIHE